MTKIGKEEGDGDRTVGARRSSMGNPGQESAVPRRETLRSEPAARARSAAGLDDHHRRMLATAQDRLERLFLEAVGGRFYGRVSIEVAFENGRPLTIRRQIEGVDK